MSAPAQWVAMTPEQRVQFVRENKADRPDPDEPAFAEWEAMRNVADDMDADERAEVLGDLADAAGLLAVLLKAPGLTGSQCHRLEMLGRHAKNLEAKRDAEYRTLNGDPR